jgi:hypothetical protein
MRTPPPHPPMLLLCVSATGYTHARVRVSLFPQVGDPLVPTNELHQGHWEDTRCARVHPRTCSLRRHLARPSTNQPLRQQPGAQAPRRDALPVLRARAAVGDVVQVSCAPHVGVAVGATARRVGWRVQREGPARHGPASPPPAPFTHLTRHALSTPHPVQSTQHSHCLPPNSITKSVTARLHRSAATPL